MEKLVIPDKIEPPETISWINRLNGDKLATMEDIFNS